MQTVHSVSLYMLTMALNCRTVVHHSMRYLLNVLLEAPGRGHVDDPPHLLGIDPHSKCDRGHHCLDLASTERLLYALSILCITQKEQMTRFHNDSSDSMPDHVCHWHSL